MPALPAGAHTHTHTHTHFEYTHKYASNLFSDCQSSKFTLTIISLVINNMVECLFHTQLSVHTGTMNTTL